MSNDLIKLHHARELAYSPEYSGESISYILRQTLLDYALHVDRHLMRFRNYASHRHNFTSGYVGNEGEKNPSAFILLLRTELCISARSSIVSAMIFDIASDRVVCDPRLARLVITLSGSALIARSANGSVYGVSLFRGTCIYARANAVESRKCGE